MKKKRMLAFGVLLAGGLLTGCQKNGEEAEALPVVRVALSSFQGQDEDLEEVSAAISEWTREQAGCEVELCWEDSRSTSDYSYFAQKESADIIFLGGGLFEEYVEKGLLYNMEDMITELGSGILEATNFTEEELTRFGGIYGIPKALHEIHSSGVMVATEYVEKYGIDTEGIRQLEDLEPILEIIAQNEEDLIPLAANYSGNMLGRYGSFGDVIDSCISMVRYDDPESVVENYYASEEYEEMIRLIRSWYEKGYLNPLGILEIEDGEDLVFSGAAFATIFVIRPDEVQYAQSRYGDAVQIIAFDEAPRYNMENDWNYVWAISSDTEYPEEAVKVLNLMYSDQTMLDLLLYGVEGEHYVVSEDGTLTWPEGEDSTTIGYFNEAKWAFNRTIASRWEGTSAEIAEELEAFEATAVTSCANGFRFDRESVEEELAQVEAVLSDYTSRFGAGTLDIDTHYPVFLQKLEEAGAEKILAEVQQQLDEWRKEKGD